MLPHLTRVSFWLATLAAGMSLFTPGPRGALLAGIAMVVLIVALVLRRFALRAQDAFAPDEAPPAGALDENGLLDVAAVLTGAVTAAGTLDEALRALRQALIHELGAQEVTVHDPQPGSALVVPRRFPFGDALASGEVTGSAAAGFALPVQRGGLVVAMLALRSTALDVGEPSLARLLALAKVALDALALRDAQVASALPRLAGQVLVVGDDPLEREATGRVLRELGLRVRLAAGALQGLQALCEAHFDLVLMDIRMSGMDGAEALAWLRRGGGGRFPLVAPHDTPVVAVTAREDRDAGQFRALGFDDHLSRPFPQDRLIAMLNQRLRHSPAAPAGDAPDAGGAPGGADATDPAPGGSVLDAGALERLRELDPKGENQLLVRVIRAFEASAERLLPQLEEARAARDGAGIRHVAHTLKSSSASIGAMKLSQLCADVEAKIRTERLENVDDAVGALRAEIGIVLQALQRLLDAPT